MSGLAEDELKSLDTLMSFASSVSVNGFNRAPLRDRIKILRWVTTLQEMSDEHFVIECTSRILDSAIMNRFRGNASGIHARADICDDEAKRRHQLAGHTADCRGADLYARGYNQALRSQGHPVQSLMPCTCGHGPKVQ